MELDLGYNEIKDEGACAVAQVGMVDCTCVPTKHLISVCQRDSYLAFVGGLATWFAVSNEHSVYGQCLCSMVPDLRSVSWCVCTLDNRGDEML